MFIQATKGVFPDGYAVYYSGTFWMGIFRSEMLIYLLWFHQFHFRCESRALKHWSEVNQRWGTTGLYSWKLTPCWQEPVALMSWGNRIPPGWDGRIPGWNGRCSTLKVSLGGSWIGSWDTEWRGQSDQFCPLSAAAAAAAFFLDLTDDLIWTPVCFL